jgi:hypothetical protein
MLANLAQRLRDFAVFHTAVYSVGSWAGNGCTRIEWIGWWAKKENF